MRLSGPKAAAFSPWTSSAPFSAHAGQPDMHPLDAIDSPRSLTRSPSVNGPFPHASASPSLLDTPFAWRSPVDAISDTGAASTRTHTPTASRPESRALDTIIEAACQDTSMAETSVFGLEHSRLSSLSSLSATNQGSPDGSWARRSPSYAPSRSTSRASSSHIEAGASASTPTFRPKQLLLIGSPRAADPTVQTRRHSAQSAPSSSSLLTFGPSHAPQSPSFGGRALTRLEPATSPRSSWSRLEQSSRKAATNEGATKSQHRAAQGHDTTACGTFIAGTDPRSWHAASTYQRLDLHDKKNDEPASGRCSGAVQGVPSAMSPIPSATSDHPDETLKRIHPPSAASHPHSTAVTSSRIGLASAVNARRGSVDVGSEARLRAVSLSPRRSSGSGETRSSETIELVPWQVATTDTASTRRSEEIFRPLSQALTMSRGGAGSSRDTIGSINLRRLNRDDGTPALSPLQTPLKGESHFVWSTLDGDRRAFLDDVDAHVAHTEANGSRVGLGMVTPAPSVGVRPGEYVYPDMAECTDADRPRVQPGISYARENRIAGPPGAVSRLLLELQGNSSLPAAQISDPNALSSAAPACITHGRNEPRSVLHHRSATVAGPLILPRQSSIRRRHLSVQLDQLPRSSLGEHVLDVPELPEASTPSSEVAVIKRSRVGFHHTRWCSYTLQAVMLVYQAVFFTFEAARLWHSLSPAVPLVAAGLFIVLDLLMVQMLTFQAMRAKLFVWMACASVPTLAYCAAVCAVDIARLTSDDQGASSAGIHLHPSRSGGELADVLQDVPMTAVLFVVGALATLVVLAGLVVVAVVALRRRRERQKAPVSTA
ncbi:hypothetical protein L1887_53932 [Cichorium endivia]|nr:hypothetical protein L1887_53932 [Cichorium endivia]